MDLTIPTSTIFVDRDDSFPTATDGDATATETAMQIPRRMALDDVMGRSGELRLAFIG